MKLISYIALFFCCLNGTAQDIHFSQFYMNPTSLNPALTGNFDGDWRFGGNQRSQWRSVSRPFNTIGFSAENREEYLLPNLYHGFNLMHDAAGDGDYRTTEVNLTSAYKYYLDLDSLHTVTAGVQLGIIHRSINFSKLNFDNQFNGYYYDPDLPTQESFQQAKRTALNFAIGAIYTFKPEYRKEITAGIGWFNLAQPKQSFFGDNIIKRDKRFVLHARATYKLNFEWDLQPALFMQFQGKYKEIVLGTNLRYIYKDKRGEFIAPYAGLWFRNNDALFLSVGAYYNNWIVGISYDINMSQLAPASNVRGGLEFSVQYILHLFKPKEIQHRICPDYL
ncbi:PorP/SprF family type IX secretion system membrane protein [Crocinitomix catalasitica]|uniref:PorP/SprF family type IX secretion system membrane protein n=1 Tax=Crocinitomix catalasitica TaxID=184607 RepID=UPI00146F95DE|nr:PorP/SprF family type IX secretion system membrane protein [Crocinitomix catalasitica]